MRHCINLQMGIVLMAVLCFVSSSYANSSSLSFFKADISCISLKMPENNLRDKSGIASALQAPYPTVIIYLSKRAGDKLRKFTVGSVSQWISLHALHNGGLMFLKSISKQHVKSKYPGFLIAQTKIMVPLGQRFQISSPTNLQKLKNFLDEHHYKSCS